MTKEEIEDLAYQVIQNAGLQDVRVKAVDEEHSTKVTLKKVWADLEGKTIRNGIAGTFTAGADRDLVQEYLQLMVEALQQYIQQRVDGHND